MHIKWNARDAIAAAIGAIVGGGGIKRGEMADYWNARAGNSGAIRDERGADRACGAAIEAYRNARAAISDAGGNNWNARADNRAARAVEPAAVRINLHADAGNSPGDRPYRPLHADNATVGRNYRNAHAAIESADRADCTAARAFALVEAIYLNGDAVNRAANDRFALRRRPIAPGHAIYLHAQSSIAPAGA